MAKTDWDVYYSSPFKTSNLTRRITQNILHSLIRSFVPNEVKEPRMAEFGGGNSFFYDKIKAEFSPSEYHVIDNNPLGLDLIRRRTAHDPTIFLHEADVLCFPADLQVDLTFSIGLIEHFSIEETRKAIATHLRCLKPGGVAIISFPTPTLLYRISRSVCELLGQWIFHDERPLTIKEVKEAIDGRGIILYDRIIWPIFLTQRILVIKSADMESA